MNSADVLVRHAQAADLPALCGLLAELFSIEKDFVIDPAIQQRALRQLLARFPDACILLAVDGPRVIGMVSVQLVVSTAVGGPSGWIEDLIVTASRRGAGLGTRLLQAAETFARRQGALRVQLLVEEANRPAVDFYRRQGWTSSTMTVRRRLLPPSA